MDSTTVKTTIILKKPEDWDDWLESIKTQALKRGVWDLINPDAAAAAAAADENLGPEPSLPLPADVNPEKTRFSELSTDEKEELLVLREEYKRIIKKYDKRRQGLVDIRADIQGSVVRGEPFNTTIGIATAKGMLQALKKRFCPTDTSRELEVQDAYLKLKETRLGKDIRVDEQLNKWRVTWDRANRLNLPDVGGLRAHKDFLRILDGPYDAWAAIQRDKLDTEEGAKTGFLDLVERFRHYLRDRRQENDSQPGIFTASLQGRAPPKARDDCLCGETHRFVACPYFAKEARKTGWKEDNKVTAQIVEKLKAHESLKEVAKRMAKEGKLQPVNTIAKILTEEVVLAIA